MKSLIKEAAKVLAVIVIVLVALFWSLLFLARFPSDASVREKFASVKPQLEALRDMLDHEPANIGGVTNEEVMLDGPSLWVSPAEAKMPVERFARYQALLKQAGMKWVQRRDEGTRFAYQAWGFASYGWRLLFIHVTRTPSSVISSLDDLRSNHSAGRRCFRQLDADWYAEVIR